MAHEQARRQGPGLQAGWRLCCTASPLCLLWRRAWLPARSGQITPACLEIACQLLRLVFKPQPQALSDGVCHRQPHKALSATARRRKGRMEVE